MKFQQIIISSLLLLYVIEESYGFDAKVCHKIIVVNMNSSFIICLPTYNICYNSQQGAISKHQHFKWFSKEMFFGSAMEILHGSTDILKSIPTQVVIGKTGMVQTHFYCFFLYFSSIIYLFFFSFLVNQFPKHLQVTISKLLICLARYILQLHWTWYRV